MSHFELVAIVMGNVAFATNALSFWMKDMVRLRMVQIVSSVCFIAYSATVHGGPLWLMICWSVFFMSINIYRLVHEKPVAARAGAPSRAT